MGFSSVILFLLLQTLSARSDFLSPLIAPLAGLWTWPFFFFLLFYWIGFLYWGSGLVAFDSMGWSSMTLILMGLLKFCFFFFKLIWIRLRNLVLTFCSVCNVRWVQRMCAKKWNVERELASLLTMALYCLNAIAIQVGGELFLLMMRASSFFLA